MAEGVLVAALVSGCTALLYAAIKNHHKKVSKKLDRLIAESTGDCGYDGERDVSLG